MTSYFNIILYYNVFPITIFWFLIRPFWYRIDSIKVIFVSAIAIPVLEWNYHFINQNVRLYRADAIYSRISSIPIEEFLNFGIQMSITTLWAIACSRCYQHWLKLEKSNQFVFYFIRYSVICALLLATVWGWVNNNGQSDTRNDCSGTMLWTTMPIIACIWYVAGNYISSAFTTMAISILVPTIYFSCVDYIAVDQHVWDVKLSSVAGVFFNNLPIEQIIYYFIFNTIIVFASAAFDKAKAVLNTFYPREQLKFTTVFESKENIIMNGKRLWKGLWTDEISLPLDIIEDFKVCFNYNSRKGELYSLLMNIIHNDMMYDWHILSGIICFTDDMTDLSGTTDMKTKSLNDIRKFISEIFYGRRSVNRFSWTDEDGNRMDSVGTVDWPYFEKCLTKEQLSVFKAFSRIAYYVPHEPFCDLLQHYEWDIDQKLLKTEADLVEFASKAYDCITDMAFFTYFHKSNQWPDNFGPVTEHLFGKMRNLGVCYVLVDTCMDIFPDSLTAGRCYIPSEYFKGDEYKWLTEERNPNKVENRVLKECADKLANLFAKLADDAKRDLKLLPIEAQAFFQVVVACAQNVADIVKRNPIYEEELILNRTKLAISCLKVLYFG